MKYHGKDFYWSVAYLSLSIKTLLSQMVVAHFFNPSTREFEASLVYSMSSRTDRTTQRNPVLQNKRNNKNVWIKNLAV